MDHLTLRDDPYAEVLADLDLALLQITWRGEIPSEMLRRIMIQAYMQVKQYSLQRFLSDTRARPKLDPVDEEWIRTDLFPRLTDTSLQRLAIVESKEAQQRQQIERIAAKASAAFPYPVDIFTDPQEAKKWLCNEVMQRTEK